MFFKRFLWMFVSPSRVFDDIRENRVKWVQPWIIVAVLYVLITWLGLPVQRALLELNPTDMPAEQLERQMEMAGKFAPLQLVFAPAVVLVIALVTAGISYVLVTVLSRAATFKQYFTLVLFTDVVGTLGYLLTTAIVRLRGVDNIMEPDDARFSLSLRMLAPENSAALKGIFGTVEFFAIWSFILLVMGLRRIFGMSTGAAVACLIPMWLIYAALSIVGELYGGMAG
jgi:hypothetical protein